MDMQSRSAATDKIFKTFLKSKSDDVQNAIQSCIQCAQICEGMIEYCLKQGGLHAEPEHIRLLRDCSDTCTLLADFMTRESNFHISLSHVCMQVCLACSIDCSGFADDELMQMCADVCDRCAESCQKLTGHH